jgi:hypothetical protein
MNRLTKHSIKDRVQIADNGCWLWTGAKKNPGSRSLAYGWVTYGGKQMNAHRASWLIHNGEIPSGLFVCHKCDVPHCVNPEHLFLGTSSDNMKDMWNKGRHSAPTSGCVGSRSSKLTLSQVQEIRLRLINRDKQSDIASDYGVCQTTISHINTKKNWGRYV